MNYFTLFFLKKMAQQLLPNTNQISFLGSATGIVCGIVGPISLLSSIYIYWKIRKLVELSEERRKTDNKRQKETEEKLKESEQILADLMQQLSEEEAKTKCSICLDNQREMLFEPCRHLAVCEDCAEEMEAKGNQECPICRQKIDKRTRIYQ